MQSWVPHIMVFVVPRQILELGDPARRSCDACESFGAMCKKIIKHLTCRRHVTTAPSNHNNASRTKTWRQSFTRGWVQQTFERLCVRQSLIHGEENARYLQREDVKLKTRGKVSAAKVRRARTHIPIRDLVDAPTVPTHLMERAFMA